MGRPAKYVNLFCQRGEGVPSIWTKKLTFAPFRGTCLFFVFFGRGCTSPTSKNVTFLFAKNLSVKGRGSFLLFPLYVTIWILRYFHPLCSDLVSVALVRGVRMRATQAATTATSQVPQPTCWWKRLLLSQAATTTIATDSCSKSATRLARLTQYPDLLEKSKS